MFQKRILDEGQQRIEHPKCKTCFAKKVCAAGGCAEAYDATGTFKKVDPESCRYIRETAKVDLHYLARAQAKNPERVARLMNNETRR
jgi:sulfatase maturation enzyme AslB (radical SAM superfamily)